MSFESWIGYVATVLLLMSTPGPSHLLMLSNSLASGFRASTATAAGDLTAKRAPDARRGPRVVRRAHDDS